MNHILIPLLLANAIDSFGRSYYIMFADAEKDLRDLFTPLGLILSGVRLAVKAFS